MERLAGFGINQKEREFSYSALEAGFLVYPGVAITCFPPVEDRRGNTKKTVTKPDFLVIHPTYHDLQEHVEITNGTGHLPSKDAQRRVIEQAGIENYCVLTGYEVDEFSGLATPQIKFVWLCNRFSWPT